MLRTSAGLGSLLVGQASQKSVPLPSKNIFFKKYGEYSVDTGMQQMIIVKNTNRVSTILCSTSVKDPRPVKRGQIGLSLSYDTAGIYIYIYATFQRVNNSPLVGVYFDRKLIRGGVRRVQERVEQYRVRER